MLLGRLETATLSCEEKSVVGEPATRERADRHELVRARQPRKDESVDAVLHGSRQQLPQETRIACIGATQALEVPRTVLLVDDSRRIAVPDEEKVQE